MLPDEVFERFVDTGRDTVQGGEGFFGKTFSLQFLKTSPIGRLAILNDVVRNGNDS